MCMYQSGVYKHSAGMAMAMHPVCSLGSLHACWLGKSIPVTPEVIICSGRDSPAYIIIYNWGACGAGATRGPCPQCLALWDTRQCKGRYAMLQGHPGEKRPNQDHTCQLPAPCT